MDLNPTEDPEFASATAAIGPDREGQRMQEALVGLFPLLLPSRKSCRKAIDRGAVLVNGLPASTAVRVKTGDEITLKLATQAPPAPLAGAPRTLMTERPEGADYVVVWKPAGLATSGMGRLNLTRVLHHFSFHGDEHMREKLTPIRRDALSAPQPVHRLDRATAGWVCVALTLKAAESLGAAFAERRVEKRYLALAAGDVTTGSNRSPVDGRDAITHWTPIADGPLPVHGTATLLDIRIETGRTHQIRRHLAESGHPIVGEDRHATLDGGAATVHRYSGHGLFLCAMDLRIPQGPHGPGLHVKGNPPRKFYRISWAARALEDHGFG